jgi:beta-galactosidase
MYRTGILKAKGYNSYGSVVAEDEVKTAGEPYKLTVDADRKKIKADGEDVSFLTVTVRDTAETVVPHADNLIRFDVTGGKLLGLSSGNPMSHADPAAEEMKVFNGKLRAMIQSDTGKGEIRVKIGSNDLKPASTTIYKR